MSRLVFGLGVGVGPASKLLRNWCRIEGPKVCCIRSVRHCQASATLGFFMNTTLVERVGVTEGGPVTNLCNNPLDRVEKA